MDTSFQDKIDFHEYFRVIMKRRWTISTVFLFVVITVTIHAFTATPIYKAVTRIVIDKENPNVVSIQEVMAMDASGTDYYQTQYKIIESRTVAREVIRRLDLKNSKEFSGKSKNLLIRFLASIKNIIVSCKNAISSLFKTDAKEGTASVDIDEIDSGLVSSFIKRISVEPIRKSRLLDIGFHARDPELAAKTANTIARAYIDHNLETKVQAIQEAVKWLQRRIEAERAKVEESEQALLNYKKEKNIITDFTNEVEQITAQKLAQLNTQVVEAESRRVEAETRYKQAVALTDTPDMLDSIPEVLNNELIKQIKSMEVDLYKRISELSKKYGQNHPQMVAIKSEMETLSKRKTYEVDRVINSLKSEYQVALARERSLKDALSRQKTETLELNQKAIEYGVLRRETESARQMYELLFNRFKETSLTEDMRTLNIRVIDKAEVPKKPLKPKKGLNILLAMVVGLVVGTLLAFFYEYLDNTIKAPDDIKRYLDVPYLGPVPAIDMNGDTDSLKKSELITFRDPKSSASEAYRDIRTSILFSSVESEPQVMLITSAGPQEGKTITASNLAVTMAQSGSKVVLVECDLRRPRIDKVFDKQHDTGLTNILVGNKDVEETIFKTEVENLFIIPSGPVPPNPSEILGSKRMTELIQTLKKNFTRIIIDSPPVAAVTDAVVLAKQVDGVIMIVRVNDKSKDMIINSLEKLRSVSADIFGIVLNGVDISRHSYYYYQYSGSYYGVETDQSQQPAGEDA